MSVPGRIFRAVFALSLALSQLPGAADAGVQRLGTPGAREEGFATGTIAGVRFRIPRDHLFFGVNDAGQTWLHSSSSSSSGPVNASSDNAPIDFFDMVLTREFKPMSAAQRRAWQEQNRVPAHGGATRQILVVVEKQLTHQPTAAANAAAIRKIVQQRLSEPASVPHARVASAPAGLVRWSSRAPGTAAGGGQDIYHDPAYRVFISCGYLSPHAPNPVEDCRQLVFIDGLPVHVTARFRADFLPQWEELYRRLDGIVRSFVVG